MQQAVPKRTVVINPCKTCQPLGAMYATLGINQGIPLVQGSQGCCTYVRYQFNRHFKEPVSIAVTSFHEDAAVFGGRRNLVEGIINLVKRYHPKVIGVVTTCSSETIGDDIEAFIKEARGKLAQEIGEQQAEEVKIIPIHTPSYAGSHVKGYDNAAKAYLENLAEKSQPNGKVNIIPGIINPGDIEEIKHLLESLGVSGNILYDISGTLDTPLQLPRPDFPEGGTTAAEIIDAANSLGSIALSRHAGGSAAAYLHRKFNVPAVLGPLPVGVANTDTFLENIVKITGQKVTGQLLRERGILLDAMADSCQYTMTRRAAVFGDPDIVAGVTRFICEIGMEPVVVLSGTETKEFTEEVERIGGEYGYKPRILSGGDLYEFEQLVKELGVDLIIGNSKGAEIAKAVKVPLVRVGFPVYDRIGYQRRPIVGYRGGVWLLDMIVNTILDYNYPTEKLQQ